MTTFHQQPNSPGGLDAAGNHIGGRQRARSESGTIFDAPLNGGQVRRQNGNGTWTELYRSGGAPLRAGAGALAADLNERERRHGVADRMRRGKISDADAAAADAIMAEIDAERSTP